MVFAWIAEGSHAAQAVSVRDLFLGVQGWPLVLHPMWVVVGISAYMILKAVMNKVCRHFETNGKSKGFKVFALLHNLMLCIFSLWTSVNVWRLTFNHWAKHGWERTFCDQTLWESGLRTWGMRFYLSKYWELLDTFLLVWKGRTPSFLQVYHHAVTIACAYMLQASHAAVSFLFVGLNSAVHTVMYLYYALTVCGVRLQAKSMITVIQIVQFCIGNAAAAPTFVLRRGECPCPSQKVAVGSIMVHAFFLTYLFVLFYKHTYHVTQMSVMRSQGEAKVKHR